MGQWQCEQMATVRFARPHRSLKPLAVGSEVNVVVDETPKVAATY
jgi:hypothetical protein